MSLLVVWTVHMGELGRIWSWRTSPRWYCGSIASLSTHTTTYTPWNLLRLSRKRCLKTFLDRNRSRKPKQIIPTHRYLHDRSPGHGMWKLWRLMLLESLILIPSLNKCPSSVLYFPGAIAEDAMKLLSDFSDPEIRSAATKMPINWTSQFHLR